MVWEGLCDASKKQIGTLTSWIGPSFCDTGSFAFLSAPKEARLLSESAAALRSELTYLRYEANASLAAYAANVLAMPANSLNGIRRPLRGEHRYSEKLMVNTTDSAAAWQRCVQ